MIPSLYHIYEISIEYYEKNTLKMTFILQWGKNL